MSTIGLRDIWYAHLTTDDGNLTGAAGLVYDTPVRIPGAISADINPNTSSATLFADDGPWESATTLGEITLDLNVADLDLATQADLLGGTYTNGVFGQTSSDTPPYVGVAFRTLKSNGDYRYYWLCKGRFAPTEESYGTKEDSIEYQTPTVTGAFVKLDFNDKWRVVGDEGDDDFDYTAAQWFSNPSAVIRGAAITP